MLDTFLTVPPLYRGSVNSNEHYGVKDDLSWAHQSLENFPNKA